MSLGRLQQDVPFVSVYETRELLRSKWYGALDKQQIAANGPISIRMRVQNHLLISNLHMNAGEFAMTPSGRARLMIATPVKQYPFRL